MEIEHRRVEPCTPNMQPTGLAINKKLILRNDITVAIEDRVRQVILLALILTFGKRPLLDTLPPHPW